MSIVAGRESGSVIYTYTLQDPGNYTQVSTLDGITAWEKTKGIKPFRSTERYLIGILIAAATFSFLQERETGYEINPL